MTHSPSLDSSDAESEFRVTLDRAGRGPARHPTHPEIALLSANFYADPDARYRWLRENAPVYWDDATGIWGIASYAHVMEASKNWEIRAGSTPCMVSKTPQALRATCPVSI